MLQANSRSLDDSLDLSLGPAREDDIERLLEIHRAAFPDDRGTEPRRRNFFANALGSFDHLYVARDRETELPVAHAFLFPLEMGFGGRVPVGGIASVAVAQEARGRGVAARLLGYLHETSKNEGHALTVLYAFRQGFYAKHGYVQARSNRRLLVSPRAFAPFLPSREPLVIASGIDRYTIEALHLRETERRAGWLVRPAPLWDRLFADERRTFFVFKRNNVTSGYIVTSLLQDEPHARVRLRVHDLVADDDSSRRALYAHLAAQRDQVTDIELAVSDDDPLELALVDADSARFGTQDLEHPLGTIAGGPMLRLNDAARAIAARTYSTDGSLAIDVDGVALDVQITNGRADVTARSVPDAEIHTDSRTLAAVAFGGWSASGASLLGHLNGAPAAIEKMSRLFAIRPFFCVDPF